ncbi:LamG domain-containing protein [Lysinibacillus sp. M3]|uniref:LamG domain-containing protein n=1 Tax=Lysinibacillus zambalensis TaxID=3160866 RepID=A0ABV1MVN9_9BACI
MRTIQVPNFNGTSSMFLPYTLYYGFDFTFEFWVKPNDATTPVDFTSFFMRGNASTANGVMVFDGKVNYRSNQSSNQGTIIEEYNSVNYPPNEWTHVAVVVRKNTQLSYYRNFELVGTFSLPVWSSSTANPISIGDWSNNYGSQFNGAIALPRLWFTARTEKEIRDNARRHIVFNTVEQPDLALDFNGVSYTNETYTLEDFEVYEDGRGYFENDSVLYSIEGKDTLVILPNNSDKTLQNYGLQLDKEYPLNQKFTKKKTVNYNTITGVYTEVTLTLPEFYIYDYIGNKPNLKYKSEITDYDVLASYIANESFDYYDLFGSTMELTYFEKNTSNETQKDVKLATTQSPLDKLSGDIKFLLWSDEERVDFVDNIMVTKAVPKNQFLTTVQNKRLYGYLKEIIVKDLSKDYTNSVKFVISDEKKESWYYWNEDLNEFSLITNFSLDAVRQHGMSYDSISRMTDRDWTKWRREYLNLGILLYDNDRETMISNIDKITYREYIPRHSTKISSAKVQILNTTPQVDLDMNGSTVVGTFLDADGGKFKYRILINNIPYYPSNGNFTEFLDSGYQINKTIDSKFVHIDSNNQIKVEFKDQFDTLQYWSTTFIGTYTGLMFKDVYNSYYSTDIGEILQYLDFGVIIAGQTTLDYEIKLKNQYGYDVENVSLVTQHMGDIPLGMEIQYSYTNAPFTPLERLEWAKIENNEEKTFFVRIKTVLEATPNANGLFHTTVKADKVGGYYDQEDEIEIGETTKDGKVD